MGEEIGRSILENGFSPDVFESLFLEYISQAGIGINSPDIGAVTLNFVSDSAQSLFAILVNQSTDIFYEHLEFRNGFIERNKKRWEGGLNKLFIYITITMEICESFCSANHNTAVDQSDHKLVALMWLHNRGCLIANEVFCLLENGFADGALARWRSLHELSATALFLKQQDASVALKYLHHEQIIQYKAMLTYNQHSGKLGNEPFSEEEISLAKTAVDELMAKYGLNYKHKYGWASGILKELTFRGIEKCAGLEHLRPYYEWAVKKVHAGHVWDYADLGTSEAKELILLAGQSNSGMTDPAHLTAISLLNLSVSLITYYHQLPYIIYSKLLSILEKDIGDTFLSIQQAEAS